MQTMNRLMSLLSNTNTQQFLKMLTNRKKNGNRGWTWFSLIGLAAVAFIAGRNQNVMHTVRSYVDRMQNAKPLQSQLNLASEFAEEFAPKGQTDFRKPNQ
ncbi:hypothetical protein ACFYKX_19020 [Cytobacillus sp. FJAT-54145]|uniref:Uncharacterized protein n=1 Tax=Cytobacillus spartinae TaxID=3299023 RepID=A0ABW6KGJ0_9BACI